MSKPNKNVTPGVNKGSVSPEENNGGANENQIGESEVLNLSNVDRKMLPPEMKSKQSTKARNLSLKRKLMEDETTVTEVTETVEKVGEKVSLIRSEEEVAMYRGNGTSMGNNQKERNLAAKAAAKKTIANGSDEAE